MSLYHSYRLLVFGRSRGGAGKYYVFQRATHTRKILYIYYSKETRKSVQRRTHSRHGRNRVVVAVVLCPKELFGKDQISYRHDIALC